MVEVVDTSTGVLHVEVVVFVRDHPCRVFGRDDPVKIAEVKPTKTIIALHEGPEFLIAAGNLDEFHIVGRKLIHMAMQTPVEFFSAAYEKWYWRGSNNGDLHEISEKVPKSLITPIRNRLHRYQTN
jgi:hypothetical protein